MAAVRAFLSNPIAQIALGAAFLLAPALINRTPYLFPDTGGYAQAGFRLLDAWVGRPHLIPNIDDSYLAARSHFYGLPYGLIVQTGTIWAVAAVQVLISAFTLRTLARVLCPNHGDRAYAALIAVLTCLSTLPFFIAFMMPDLFAGLAIAWIALLTFYPDALTGRERGWTWALLVAALTFHASHAMTAAILIPALIAVQFARARPEGMRALRLTGSAFAAALALMTISAAANAFSPAPQRAPPFLTARLLANGPGRVWLREACGRDANAYTICRFRDQPLDRDEPILWSGERGVGVFSMMPVQGRMAMIQEQPRFVRDVILHYPLETALAALGDAGDQLINIRLSDDYVFGPETWLAYGPNFYTRIQLERAGCTSVATCGSRVPLGVLSLIHSAAFVAGLIALAVFFALTRRRSQSPDDIRFWLLAGAIIAGVAVNAIVCGAISGPYARYQARVAWLIPMLAILAEARFAALRGLLRPRAARG